MTPRLWAVCALGVLAIGFAAAAATLIPWHRPPAPRADQLTALSEIPADRVARARAYQSAMRPGLYGSLAVGVVVALVLGLTPVGARLVALFGGNWIARAVLGGLAILLLTELVTLPFAAWRHVIAVRYDISVQTWGPWFVDRLKSFAIGAVLGAVVLFLFFLLARVAPRYWWAWAAAGAAALVVLLSFIVPVVVEPIFNKFTPMAEGPLRTELTTMAARDGVPVRDVLVADASRRTRAVNAYVSGFGPTRRIVVYDTLLKEAPAAEVESVVAHELGHAKDGDVVTGTLLCALGAAAAVCALALLGAWTGLLRRAGVDSLGEPAGLALLLAVGAVAGLLAGPLQNLVSRRIEARADAHALAL